MPYRDRNEEEEAQYIRERSKYMLHSITCTGDGLIQTFVLTSDPNSADHYGKELSGAK